MFTPVEKNCKNYFNESLWCLQASEGHEIWQGDYLCVSSVILDYNHKSFLFLLQKLRLWNP